MTDSKAGNYHPTEKDQTCGEYLGQGFIIEVKFQNVVNYHIMQPLATKVNSEVKGEEENLITTVAVL